MKQVVTLELVADKEYSDLQIRKILIDFASQIKMVEDDWTGKEYDDGKVSVWFNKTLNYVEE